MSRRRVVCVVVAMVGVVVGGWFGYAAYEGINPVRMLQEMFYFSHEASPAGAPYFDEPIRPSKPTRPN